MNFYKMFVIISLLVFGELSFGAAPLIHLHYEAGKDYTDLSAKEADSLILKARKGSKRAQYKIGLLFYTLNVFPYLVSEEAVKRAFFYMFPNAGPVYQLSNVLSESGIWTNKVERIQLEHKDIYKKLYGKDVSLSQLEKISLTFDILFPLAETGYPNARDKIAVMMEEGLYIIKDEKRTKRRMAREHRTPEQEYMDKKHADDYRQARAENQLSRRVKEVCRVAFRVPIPPGYPPPGG